MSAVYNWPYPFPDGPEIAQRLAQAEQTIRQLTDRIGQLERQLEELRNKPSLHVAYHFDQLKVNELKGTLNVGLSPQGVQGIDSFETPFTGNWQVTNGMTADEAAQPIGQLQQQMLDYMDREGPGVLFGLEQKYGVSLGEDHRQRVLNDVKTQLKDRVHYYAKTSPYPAVGTEEERRLWGQSVIDKTTKDVGIALTTYVESWKEKYGEGGKKQS
ncbi:hypothetical protein GE107_12125 [Cohnella sp. CFH 77786]|uniref:spore germination protein GerPC n=1 Tax=Cohnella sp. CFH 77786 TaxID=2662265 RepID=UPI001C60B413|nr:spore germination protein GerPC [Cohnella sp. CFH 77786]MBW5446810.1 hypothetical protein [Cohnella sp. CFH 77786]